MRLTRHTGRSLWVVLAIFTPFVVLVMVGTYRFLLPAMRAVKNATPQQKTELRAISALVLALLLFTLLVGLILAFRPGRFFLPRGREPRTRTQYTDAWAESAKRLEVPPEEPEDSDDAPPK